MSILRVDRITPFQSSSVQIDGLDAVTTNSFNTFTSSADVRLGNLEVESESIRTELNTFTSSADVRLGNLEVESGSIRTELNNFTGSYNTGSFTGSFIGDGSGLTGLPGGGGGGLAGTQYIFVAADGTDTENATELSAAYTTAKTMSPSATNRITIVAAPGNYNFGSSTFVMDTQYIDLVSLDGNRSVIFNATLNTDNRTQGSISITANDVFVKGVDVGTKAFTIGSNLSLLKVENCKGGDNFAKGEFFGTISGTFTDCEGGVNSFGANAYLNVSGTFTNCIAGDSSFCNSYFGAASGVFTNCKAGTNSFGYGVGDNGNTTASGTFTNCIAGDSSFGSTTSGTFTNCIAGASSFGATTLSGKLFYCRLTSGTFQTVSGAGVTRLCLDGSNVENNQG